VSADPVREPLARGPSDEDPFDVLLQGGRRRWSPLFGTHASGWVGLIVVFLVLPVVIGWVVALAPWVF
jgi:hypothetical protein